MAFIISADDIKKNLPGYDPKHSDVLHRESARLADKEFEKALKTRQEIKVILMSGGTASGKTEYVSAYLKNRNVIIFDGTLPSFEGAKIKCAKVAKSGKSIEVHAVMPISLQKAFIAFLNRDRKFPPEHFFRTHSACRKTLLEITREMPAVTVRVFFSESIISKDQIDTKFTELSIPNRGVLIEYLEQNQYTENELKQMQGLL
ncbi:hypothetical protein BH23PAT2_BH23PAT2_09420 [soil metagenome]